MKQSTSRNFKVLIKQKNNPFIDRLKKQEYVTVKENLIVKFDGLLFFKLFIQEDYYTHRDSYIFKFNSKEFLFDFVFIYSDIILFTYKKNIYILSNAVPALEWNDANFSDNLLSVLKTNEFPLETENVH
jgi:hypothetical protein